MPSLTTTLRHLGFLIIALSVALIANFAYGQWTNPSVAPTGGNVDVPVNVGNSYQNKAGDLGAGRLRTDQFCDSTGTTCFRACEVTGTCTPTYSNCTVNGTSVAHGSSRTFYSLTSTTGSCSSYAQSRSCSNGTMSGSSAYQYASCSTVAPPPVSTCSGTTIRSSITGTTAGTVWGTNIYTNDSALGKAAVHAGLMTVGQTANIQVTLIGDRTSFTGSTRNGVTSNSYSSSWCAMTLSLASTPTPPPPTYSNCTLNGATVAHGSSRTFYTVSSYSDCSTAPRQTRTCSDGTLSGNAAYQWPTCTTVAPTVTYSWATPGPWGSCTGGACGATGVQYRNVTCINNSSGSVVSNSLCPSATRPASSQLCAMPACTYSNCTLDGVTVAHGSSRTFYSLTSTTGSCTSYDQIRTCNNGTLNGSTAFRYRSCSTFTPPPPPTYSNCSLGGATVLHGSSRTFYSRTSATNCSLYDQIRTCNNGTLNGSNSYQYANCAVPSPCTYWGSNWSIPGGNLNVGNSRAVYNAVQDRGGIPSCSYTVYSCSSAPQAGVTSSWTTNTSLCGTTVNR